GQNGARQLVHPAASTGERGRALAPFEGPAAGQPARAPPLAFRKSSRVEQVQGMHERTQSLDAGRRVVDQQIMAQDARVGILQIQLEGSERAAVASPHFHVQDGRPVHALPSAPRVKTRRWPTSCRAVYPAASKNPESSAASITRPARKL